MKNSGRPYAGTRLANYLERRILELKSKKTQTAIALEAGFINPNMLDGGGRCRGHAVSTLAA